MSTKIVTRFAPSPTGFLHVGGLRTALYAYLFAKKNSGTFLLRIEDTDQARKVAGAQENLVHMLEHFGLTPDNDRPVIQSERIEIHQLYAHQLVEQGHAYYDFYTKEELENLKNSAPKDQPYIYRGHANDWSEEEVKINLEQKKPYVIRLKVPETGETTFTDSIRGEVTFQNNLLDDIVLLKSDGYPTYHLAHVVDDHDMNISHVIRGEEWLPSAPKHILLHKALGWEAPQYAHLPLLLNPDKSKLSKRQGDVAVEDYLSKGYLEEALLNFVLLLGWNPKNDEEIFPSLESMIERFDLSMVNKAGAVFDTQKLDWMNSQYIQKLSAADLAKRSMPFFDKIGNQINQEQLEKFVLLEQQRIKRLDEIVEAISFLISLPDYEGSLLVWKKMTSEQALTNLTELHQLLTEIDDADFTVDKLEDSIKRFVTHHSLSNGEVLWPLRVALSGQKNSPGPFEIAAALGKTETLRRIKEALDKLKRL